MHGKWPPSARVLAPDWRQLLKKLFKNCMAYFVKVKMLWWKLTSCFMPLWKAHVSGLKFRTSTGTFKELDCRHFRCALKNGNATVQQACKKLMYCFKLVGKLRLRLLHIVRGISVSSLIIPPSIQRGKKKFVCGAILLSLAWPCCFIWKVSWCQTGKMICTLLFDRLHY